MTDKRVTQVAIEQWIKGPAPSGQVTQVAVEHWSTVAFYRPGVLNADGQAQAAFTGRLVRMGVAHMDGLAQASFVGVRMLVGAAHMDGHASVAFSRIAVYAGPAVMNGYAQVVFGGVAVTKGAAHMDGVASMVVPRPLGAGVAQMDGTSSMVVTRAGAGPQTYPMSLAETVIWGAQFTKLSHDMHVQLSHILNIRQPMVASARYKRAYSDSFTLGDRRTLRLVQKLREAMGISASPATHSHYYYTVVTPISIRPSPVPAIASRSESRSSPGWARLTVASAEK